MSLLGSLGSVVKSSVPSLNMASLTSSLSEAIQTKLTGPGTLFNTFRKKATNIQTQVETAKQKVANVATKIQDAPKIITNTVVSGIGDKLASAGIAINKPPSIQQTSTGPEQLGPPPTQADPGTQNLTGITSGGGLEDDSYEIVHLTRKIKNPLYVFYLDGNPIYFTQNSKDEVEIIPLYADIVMSNTSARHKYTKKVNLPKRHSNHTVKHSIKGIRKVSHKAKQKHSRKSH